MRRRPKEGFIHSVFLEKMFMPRNAKVSCNIKVYTEILNMLCNNGSIQVSIYYSRLYVWHYFLRITYRLLYKT